MSNKLNRKSKGDIRRQKKAIRQAVAQGGRLIDTEPKKDAKQAFVEALITQLKILDERAEKLSLRQLWGVLDCLEVVTDSVRRTFILTTAFSQGIVTREEVKKDPQAALQKALDVFAAKLDELDDDKRKEIVKHLHERVGAMQAK